MQELREEIKAIKLEKEMSKKENIELQAKIKKLEMVINEREENILMIYQELDYYMRKFNEEKFNHNNFKNEFNILEKKIYRLEEERQKEKNKINANDIKDIDSLSPKHYIKEDNYGSPSPTNFTINNNS
jgi:septal ring factor EnvC (AmiA/AmiB activator)